MLAEQRCHFNSLSLKSYNNLDFSRLKEHNYVQIKDGKFYFIKRPNNVFHQHIFNEYSLYVKNHKKKTSIIDITV